ncbi:MAG: hypothetical protein Q9212_003668 [Teloschistes hypoglaucus]
MPPKTWKAFMWHSVQIIHTAGIVGLDHKKVGNLCRVLCVTLEAHGKRLVTDEQLLGRRSPKRASCVAKGLGLAADGKGTVGEALSELGLGVVSFEETIWVIPPVGSATVDDDAAYCDVVATDPFGE